MRFFAPDRSVRKGGDMARLSREDQRRRPALTKWLRDDLPRLHEKPRVFDAFLEYSGLQGSAGLSPLSVKTPLTWGHGPQIIVTSFPCEADGRKRMGLTPSANKVLIAEDIVDRFQRRPRDARLQLILEATVLHELCHWAEIKTGRYYLLADGGDLFEQAAYGRIVGRGWQACPPPKS
jgi:Metallopeptidase toxin 3